MGTQNVKRLVVPDPILDAKELADIDALSKKYEKLTKPGLTSKAVKKIGEVTPSWLKELTSDIGESFSEQELLEEAMKVIAEGYNVIQENAAKFTISERLIVKSVNEAIKDQEISSVDEFCLVRGYELAKLVDRRKFVDLALAFGEGGVTGFVGFAGIPFNLVLSTFLYFRAVQAVAISYGFDVKSDPVELAYASEVFVASLSPRSSNASNPTSLIGRIMLVSELEAVKQTAKKSWTEMAARNGIPLLLTQMRALAHKSAQSALEGAGKKGLEQTVFKNVFEQIGKRLTLSSVERAVPVVGGVFGALFDTGYMNRTIAFASTFYHKRFLLEKQVRVEALASGKNHSEMFADFEMSVDISDMVEAEVEILED